MYEKLYKKQWKTFKYLVLFALEDFIPQCYDTAERYY